MKQSWLNALLCCAILGATAGAQQKNPPKPQVEKSSPSENIANRPANAPEEPRAQREERRQEDAPQQPRGEGQKPSMKWDMTETAPVVTHHEINVNGRALRYTATVGRLPIKDLTGTTEALMFYVAYTLDGQDATKRPVTFAFNGGPGSASIWLHMGALGPRRVALQQDGMMPPSPYHLIDNPGTPLEKTDLVLIDAIGTGFSRPADLEKGKKFWSVKGDIEAFGEFIRLYITRNERWASPLYIFGESYGTTRAAGISGYLVDRGIAFNGICLLSEVLNFETLEFSKSNDLGYQLTLPSYTMIAGYHKMLAPELLQNMEKTKSEVEQFANGEYAQALQAGDSLTADQRAHIVEQLAKYTGLKKDFIEQSNMRIDVRGFTHNLLIDQKLRVGRLDGRYTGPDPNGLMDTPFYDPTGSATDPPFTATFNNYLRNDLGYKTDMPYYVSARDMAGATEPGQRGGGPFQWEWGSAIEGYPDTATALRAAMVKDPYLKVLVMEGDYDLATPYFAANYTMNHLDLTQQYRKNISYARYAAGHMVYLPMDGLAKMKKDYDSFLDQTANRQ
ncbi:peptidase S10, serine carboxypeptidase [Candidatus Koribacter versatilis Ellin345]|uniref:Peptidase S10, serine carboxypeptidase n=1 Tax=Koribacter versatilis (strain Ellin345) TaxID=204669 RepID=Q1IJE7_KORVE|nr:peptidase S10, serine carboxypeptidase [Candidatus Koribacter versatilis]ABF43003.1 peptidase S10, serine carboxypeptidase [Candidatus Koribacter versatilis Ellin345]